MQLLTAQNPFSAPVFFEETVDSTMNVSRKLAEQGQPHGTVICADFQETGRGRIQERTWEAEKGKSLLFTIILRYAGVSMIPGALTLRVGLAVCLAIEDTFPGIKNRLLIKWPNDILCDTKKICGILTEANNGTAHIGIGINVCQREFPLQLQNCASSISLAAGIVLNPEIRFDLLAAILSYLHSELKDEILPVPATNWQNAIDMRLYKKGEQVSFFAGAAGSGKLITGCLCGINADGGLIIQTAERQALFYSGELVLT